jgi:hypothetical protein
MNEDFPAPEGPTSASILGGPSSFRHICSTSASRPKKYSASSSVNEAEILGALDAEGDVFEGARQGVSRVEAAFAFFGYSLLDHRCPRRVRHLRGLGAHAFPDALP